jgi:hypothetical protein
MRQYQPGFSEQECDRLKAAISEIAQGGSFDAANALPHWCKPVSPTKLAM